MSMQQQVLPFIKDKELCAAVCCDAMDLMALASKSELSVHRSMKWDTLCRKAYGGSDPNTLIEAKISSLAWSPNGRMIAVGHDNGSISIFDAEFGEKLGSILADETAEEAQSNASAAACSFLRWSPHLSASAKNAAEIMWRTGESEETRRLRNEFVSRSSKYLRPPLPIPDNVTSMLLGKKYEDKKTSLREKKLVYSKLDAMIAGYENARVRIMAFGHIPIGELNFSMHGDAIVDAQLSPCFRHLIATISDKKSSSYSVVQVNVQLLCSAKQEIGLVASESIAIQERISKLEEGLQLLQRHWKNSVVKPLDEFITPLHDAMQSYDRPGTADDELFTMLTCGSSSSALESFLGGLTEEKLSRTHRSIDQACELASIVVANFVEEHVEALVFLLGDILGLAKWKARFAPLGLTPESVSQMLAFSKELFDMCKRMSLWLYEARADTAALLNWLQLIVIKETCSPEEFASRKPLPALDSRRLVEIMRRVQTGSQESEARFCHFVHERVSLLLEGSSSGGSGDARSPLSVARASKAFWRNKVMGAVCKKISSSFADEGATKFGPRDGNIGSSGGLPPRLFSVRIRKHGELDGSDKGNYFVYCACCANKKIYIYRRELPAETWKCIHAAPKGILESILTSGKERAPPSFPWQCCSVGIDPDCTVDDIAFYGPASVQMTPTQVGASSESLLLTMTNGSERTLSVLSYDTLEFSSVGVPGGNLPLCSEGATSCSCPSYSINDELLDLRQRVLIPTSWSNDGLIVSGSRGVACVFTASTQLQLFDMEHDEGEDDDSDSGGESDMDTDMEASDEDL